MTDLTEAIENALLESGCDLYSIDNSLSNQSGLCNAIAEVANAAVQHAMADAIQLIPVKVGELEVGTTFYYFDGALCPWKAALIGAPSSGFVCAEWDAPDAHHDFPSDTTVYIRKDES